MRALQAVVLCASALACAGFNFGPLPNLFGPSPAALEDDLLRVARDGDAKPSAVLSAFRALEDASPAPADLLRREEGLRKLDGDWMLTYTIAATVGESLEARGVGGVVNASGIVVKADEGRSAIQSFDVGSGRVENRVNTKLPIFGDVVVRVSGPFAAAADVGRRAEIQFDRLEFLREDGSALFSAEWPFKLQRALKPELANGEESTSWLDTVYISDMVRLGKGNKGSWFILARPGRID